jgi:hypothetical protein
VIWLRVRLQVSVVGVEIKNSLDFLWVFLSILHSIILWRLGVEE